MTRDVVAPRSGLRRVRRYLRECVRVDTRSLAVFRAFAGVLVLADVLLRARNLTYFYTDDGVVPRWLAMEATPDYAFSVYFLSGDPAVTLALFVVQFLFALSLVVGYRTRVALVVSFLFVISLDHRNPLVLSHADTLFRLLLFWGLFLPLGERWSVDAVHREREPRESVAGVASFLLLFQMVFMYAVNGINKLESDGWHTGEAAALVLGLDNITFLLGDLARNVPTLLTYGGRLWFYMLLSAWLLILLPGRYRASLVGMFAAVHLSFALTVRIGAFPYVALLGLVPFLQGALWRDLAAVANRLGRRFGLHGSRLRGSRLEEVATRFPDVRFDSGRLGVVRTHAFTATLAVVVVTVLVVAAVLATSAGTLAAGDSDEREEELTRILEETRGIEHVHTVAGSLNVQQPGWTIFAPNPRSHDRYHVFPARTADGELLDVYNERPLTFDRPRDQLHREFDTYRERFYMGHVRSDEHEAVREELVAYYCTDWATEQGVELTHVNIYHVTEDVTLATLDDPGGRERNAWEVSRHVCGNHEPERLAEPDV